MSQFILKVEEHFAPITLETGGEKITLCIVNGAFEVMYNGDAYRFEGGRVGRRESTSGILLGSSTDRPVTFNECVEFFFPQFSGMDYIASDDPHEFLEMCNTNGITGHIRSRITDWFTAGHPELLDHFCKEYNSCTTQEIATMIIDGVFKKYQDHQKIKGV
jgi:hypothetical protein